MKRIQGRRDGASHAAFQPPAGSCADSWRAKWPPNTIVMQNPRSVTNGPEEDRDAYSVEELLSALSETQYRRLLGYARLRLRAAASTRWLQQCLAATDGEDLVHQAVLKLLLGEQDPALGRHLKPGHRVSQEAFVACVKGVICSDLSNLVNSARSRHNHAFIGDPDVEAGAVEPVEAQDPRDLLSRRDLHRVFFRQLYERIATRPALLAVVQDWEQRFYEDDRIGHTGSNRDLVYRVRRLAREIVAGLSDRLSPSAGTGKELLL